MARGFFKFAPKKVEDPPVKKKKRAKGEVVDKEIEALVEKLNKRYPFQPGCETGLDVRIARGELGQRILKRSINDDFEMYGEDNVLL